MGEFYYQRKSYIVRFYAINSMMLSRMSMVILLEPLVSWLFSVRNLLTNVSQIKLLLSLGFLYSFSEPVS